MYQAPRGTADILPEDQPYWEFIREKAAVISRRFGYHRVDTPTFEDTRLFTRSVGEGTDIVEKQMYTCEDRGGSLITLRPEGTAPVCRAYVEHGMASFPQPVKLYYLASVFRYERPQAGRYREHHQFGCEAIGEADAGLDAEVVQMARDFYLSLGLKDLSLQLNSIGDRQCRPTYLAALKDYYAARLDRLCPDCRARFDRSPLRLLDCKNPTDQAIAAGAPRTTDYLCPGCADHFGRLRKYLDLLGLPYTLNHRLVRGLDYYTRTVFEIQPELEGSQSALGGGGRYDSLIEELGGRPTPAIGFAAGIERIILNLKEQGVTVPGLPEPRAFVAYLGEAAREQALRLAAGLREKGIIIVTGFGGRSLKAQLRQANNLKARYAIIIGEEEVKAGTVVLRNMATSEQENAAVGEVAGLLAEV